MIARTLLSHFLIFLFATLPAHAEVNKWNGIAITTASKINGITPIVAVNGLTVVAGGATDLLNQTFEGAGYDNGETWIEAANPDEDYTTGPLEGSQSLRISAVSQYTYTTFTSAATVYAYFLIKFVSPGEEVPTFGFLNAALTEYPAALRSYPLGVTHNIKLRTNGSDSASSITNPANGQTWHVWIDWVNAGTCVLAMSQTGTRPTVDGSGVVYLTKTGGSDNAGAMILATGATVAGEYLLDNVKVRISAPYGDNGL